jgi:hypothetical protein
MGVGRCLCRWERENGGVDNDMRGLLKRCI